MDATIVYGVNHPVTADMTVVSNACTTNCLPRCQARTTVGIVKGLMTTIHAFTNDQVTDRRPAKICVRARSATQNMIPTKTGAAKAVGLVPPQMNGKLDGFAVRVPTINVAGGPDLHRRPRHHRGRNQRLIVKSRRRLMKGTRVSTTSRWCRWTSTTPPKPPL